MMNRDIEFQENVIKLMIRHNIKIQLANSKESIRIVEKFNYILQEWAFLIQDAVEMRLFHTECYQTWVKDLLIFL